MRKMYATIKKFGILDRTSLQKECGKMSITKYNSIKPYFEEEYEGRIECRKEGKMTFFIDLNPATIEQEKEIQLVLEKFNH